MTMGQIIKRNSKWRPSRLPRGYKRSDVIETVRAFVPERGQEYIDPAFGGCPDAALSLVCSCYDYQRSWLAERMKLAKVAPPAFRVTLEEALTQNCCFLNAFRASKGILGMQRWCQYAQFPIPNDLPEQVTAYRGTQFLSFVEALRSPFWTLERAVADRFATRWHGYRGLVIEAMVARKSIFFYSDAVKEAEVMFPDWLGWFDRKDVVEIHHVRAIEPVPGGNL
jgi:hypothetical protein